MMKKIVLTGGGTAGHVTPNLALLPELKKRDFDILYIGGKNGMEAELAGAAGISYRGISTGKLRRYFDLKNFTDPFRVIKGFFDAVGIIRSYRPDIVFSKGGFVAVPVTAAAWVCRVPVISHESDMTPGLANRLAAPFVKKICCNFPETAAMLPKNKAVLTGSPIREELLKGSRNRGLELLGFGDGKPVLMMIGGSLGAQRINKVLRADLKELLRVFDIVHICGKGNLEPSLEEPEGYRQFEFVSTELKDIFAAADIVISRAGANSICELLALKKPNLLIPLSAAASRGDQILNAGSFEKQGFSMVLREEEMNEDSLVEAVLKLWSDRAGYISAMESSGLRNGVEAVMREIEAAV